MEKCENCNHEHNGSYGSGRFCSTECARSFSTKDKRKEINNAVSKKLLGRRTRSNYSYTEEKWKQIKEKREAIFKERLLNADYKSLGVDTLRKRVILEQDNKCNKCKLSEWLGEKIILELEHIDGNHHNNERINIEALCPNCHSLTPTWRGRNKKGNLYAIKTTDEQLLKALVGNNFNMRQTLLSVGLAAKGGNYKRCHRLKNEFEELTP